MSKIGYLLSKKQISWKSPNLNHFGIKLRKYINFKRSYNFTFSLIFPRWCSRGVLICAVHEYLLAAHNPALAWPFI